MSAVMNICEAELQTLIRQRGLFAFSPPKDEIKRGISNTAEDQLTTVCVCTCHSQTLSIIPP